MEECDRCKRYIPDDADFCCYCAKPQNTKSARTNPKENEVYVSFNDGRYMFMVCSLNEEIMLDVHSELQRSFGFENTLCLETASDRNRNYVQYLEKPQNMRTFSVMQKSAIKFIKNGSLSRVNSVLESFFLTKGYTKKIRPDDEAIIYEK